MSEPRLTDISVIKHRETEKAILVSECGDETRAVWLPKSQIEINNERPDRVCELTLPEWLAKDKGLI